MTQLMSLSDREVVRSQVEVLSIAEAFFQSSVLFALVKLRIFDLIGEGSKTLQELALALHTRPDTLGRLLNAGVALKLLESQHGSSFMVGPRSRIVLLPEAGDNYLGNWILNLEYFQSALSKLDEAVLNSAPTLDPTTHVGKDKARTREFMLAMHNYAALRGKELAKFLDTTGCKTFLDLGCGPGTYAYHVGMRNRNLELYLLDLPPIVEIAKEIAGRYSLENIIHYVARDVLKEEVPGSYDLILVSNTLHMLGEEVSRTLIRRLYKSVNPGGSIVVQAQYLEDGPVNEKWPIFVDLVQLCTTSNGRNHSVGETKKWLEEAGFRNIQFCSMSIFNTSSFLRAYKSRDGGGENPYP